MFTATAEACINLPVTVTDASTIPSGSIVSWQWDLGDGTTPTRTGSAAFTHVYATAGTYKVRLVAVSALGCKSLPSEKSVLVSPDPVANFTLPASVCFPGNPVNMTNTSTVADNSGLTYDWDFGDGSPRSASANGSRSYATAGNYTITLVATSGKGCRDTVSKTFGAFVSRPVARFGVSSKDICQGVESLFRDSSTATGSSLTAWAWSFGDGTTASTKDPSKKYSLPGRFAVRLVVTNAAGCVSDPFIDSVRVYLQPVVDAGPSFVVQQGSRVDFRPVVNDTTLAFQWSPTPDLSPATQLKASVTARQDQVYRLTAFGQNGCSSSDTLLVRILLPVVVPNVFSPNGDGVHDTWEIRNLADYPGYTIQVFNRYGQPVYSAAAGASSWDGRANGVPLPVGVYYYIIDLKNGFQKLNGSITIIR
ncbi:MAG: PKD domain-containing protein [Chitinophagia bacterium]|nr:PKD domain-containing protein [Chitinophagia bacterium]